MLSMLVLPDSDDADDDDAVGSSIGGADFADRIVSPGPKEGSERGRKDEVPLTNICNSKASLWGERRESSTVTCLYATYHVVSYHTCIAYGVFISYTSDSGEKDVLRGAIYIP
jgi:hypothetical protein